MAQRPEELDSFRQLGGIIPGTPSLHAYALSGPRPSAIPVLVAVPHAGRAYSGTLLEALRNPESAALRLEDRLADSLGRAVAAETGATLLVANAPRAMIDLNRAPEDIDWEMFGRDERPAGSGTGPSHRARNGLGLIPRRVPGSGELWKRLHNGDELATRIAGIHTPYHEALARSLAEMRVRWGMAVLLDLHSMPPIAPRAGSAPPQFVIGDRFGESCDNRLVAAMASFLDRNDQNQAYNRPYAGGYTLERHGAPARGIHAVQLEVDRSAYLDPGLSRIGEGFARTLRLLVGLVRLLAEEAMQLYDAPGQAAWRDAAE